MVATTCWPLGAWAMNCWPGFMPAGQVALSRAGSDIGFCFSKYRAVQGRFLLLQDPPACLAYRAPRTRVAPCAVEAHLNRTSRQLFTEITFHTRTADQTRAGSAHTPTSQTGTRTCYKRGQRPTQPHTSYIKRGARRPSRLPTYLPTGPRTYVPAGKPLSSN